jgi:hypothetical protein
MPAQPLPDAAAQQQAAVDVFAQYEPALYEAYLDMIVEWLAAVKTAMFAGGVVQLALLPDPMTVFSQGPKWAAVTAQYTAKIAEEVLAAPYRDLFADGTLFDTRPFVRNWIAGADNRLSHVPNEVFGLVSHIINAGTTNGASINDVQQQIGQLFEATGMEHWKAKARTVARTEVVGAYNGGLHDAFSMLVAADPDTAYVKRWLATEDQRTRPDHRDADGQTVPWGQPFILGADEFGMGGVEMMHPHDPSGPADQIVNCRCVELLEIKNEPTKMGNRQYKGPPSLAAAGITLAGLADHDDCTLTFCMLTHKPGLCKGQKRGQREPGYQEETKKTPAQVAQTAVSGLNTAIAQAQAVAAQNPGNPKLAAMARRAIAGYKRALGPHQQKLKDAARTDRQAQRTGDQDTRQQDTLDRQAQRHKDTLKRRAQKITERRAEKAKLAKMSRKQRTAYRKAKADAGRKQRTAQENKTLEEAAQ